MTFKNLFVTLGLLLCGVNTCEAAEWPIPAMQVGENVIEESRFFYVGKGEQWTGAHFQSTYSSTGGALISISLDRRYLTNQRLEQNGSINFNLPTLGAGFHRMDFLFKQQADYGNIHTKEKSTVCEPPLDGITIISDAKLSYSRNQPAGLQIRNLPDALFNPQATEMTAYTGTVKFDSKNNAEITAIARLASAWSANAGVHWVEADASNAAAADFGIEIRHVAELTGGAQTSLTKATDAKSGQHPILLIAYKDDRELDSAVNALLTATYLEQIHSDKVMIPANIPAPQWGTARAIKTLADLGVDDLRLDSVNHSLALNFPAVWQPTDLLQGNIALRTQDGLMKGSNLTVWLDNAMAGSLSLEAWDSTKGTRSLYYLGGDISSNTYIDLRLESALIANGDCQPHSRGSLWIDAHKSQINFPHRLKTGVSGLSAALITRPDIAINGSPGSMGVALALLQTASKMLLNNEPIAANLKLQNKQGGAMVYIQTDAEIYQKLVTAHTDKIFGPYAKDGAIVTIRDDQYQVVSESASGAGNFMMQWPQLQAAIPDGVQAALITTDGKVLVLSSDLPSTTEIPEVKESTITRWIALIFIVLLAVIIWWIRRTVRNSTSRL